MDDLSQEAVTVETAATGTHKRRASDAPKRMRVVGGWLGIGMGALAFVVGLVRANDIMAGLGFLATMVAANVLPFEAVRSLLPAWGRRE